MVIECKKRMGGTQMTTEELNEKLELIQKLKYIKSFPHTSYDVLYLIFSYYITAFFYCQRFFYFKK